jgi:spore germination protein YaaH
MRSHRQQALRPLAWLALPLLLLMTGQFSTKLQAAQQPSPRLVLGYYVPYDPTSWQSLAEHADQLDMVAAQWVTIDPCGNLTSRDDQTLKQLAQQHNVKVLPSLLTLSGWLNHQLLADDETAAHAVEQIVGYTLAEGYDGFDLDLEGVNAADRPLLTRFVSGLGSALHDSGKLLTLAIPAKERDVTTSWAGAYDYAALAAAADLVTVMAYEFRGPFSGPGSVAPYDWVARVAAFSTSQVPPEKVLLGLSFYGYDWNTTSGGTRSLGYPHALALSNHYGAPLAFDLHQQSATFTYEATAGEAGPRSQSLPSLAHHITSRIAPPCDLLPPPAPAPTPTPTEDPGTPQSHEVWLEEAASAEARLAIADRYATGGVAAWRLGLEEPRVWDLFADWRMP